MNTKRVKNLFKSSKVLKISFVLLLLLANGCSKSGDTYSGEKPEKDKNDHTVSGMEQEDFEDKYSGIWRSEDGEYTMGVIVEENPSNGNNYYHIAIQTTEAYPTWYMIGENEGDDIVYTLGHKAVDKDEKNRTIYEYSEGTGIFKSKGNKLVWISPDEEKEIGFKKAD